MWSIDPSHFVTVSFLLFVLFILKKRFFNADKVIDQEIARISNEIAEAAHKRSEALIRLKEIASKNDLIELEVTAIIQNAHETCETLAQNIREQIAFEIDQYKLDNAAAIRHIEDRIKYEYQDSLVHIIFNKLNDQIKQMHGDGFFNAQTDRSLRLLSALDDKDVA